MRFKEAIELKNKIGDTFESKGMEYLTLIVPSDYDEKMKYLEFVYSSSEFKDENAKLYSQNNEFDIVGLYDDFNVFIHTSEHPYRNL